MGFDSQAIAADQITMKDPSTKSELLQAFIAARVEWDTLSAKIPTSDRMSDPVEPGQWSIKDIIAHITEYDRHMGLGLALRLQKPPQLWLDELSLDDFNDRLHQQIADRDPDGVLLDSQQVYQELIGECRGSTPKHFYSVLTTWKVYLMM